jgi:integrase
MPHKRGSVWWVSYTDAAGVRRREPTEACSKTEAKDIEGKLRKNAWLVKKGLEVEMGADKPFEVRALQWLAERPKDYRSRDTAETYLRQRILPHLGKKPCRAIRRADVLAMLLANEQDRPGQDSKGRPIVLKAVSPATREKLRGYVHAIFEWLIEDLEEVDGANPAGGKRLRVKPPKRLPRYIPVPELVALLREIPWHYRLLFVFAIVSAARKGELLPLEWSDVNLLERQVHIHRSRTWTTTKGKRERYLTIPDWLLPMFEAEKARGFSTLVFPNANGKRHRMDVKLTRVMRAAAGRAGLVTGYVHKCRRKGCGLQETLPEGTPRPCPQCGFMSWVVPVPKRYQFKDLRSTFATLATAESGDLRFVQQVLGHESYRTTETSYVHALSAGLRAKMDALRAFSPLAGTVTELCPPNREMVTNGVTQSGMAVLKH